MEIFEELWDSITQSTPRVLLAVLILLVGLLAARFLSKTVFVLLARTSIDDWAAKRLGVKTGGRYGHRVERIVARTVFYAVLVVVAVLVLNTLQFEDINRPLLNLLDEILLALPNVLLAFIVVFFFFVIGKLLAFSLSKGLQAVNMDERLTRFGGLVTKEGRLSETIGAVAFWFVMVIGIIQGLDALKMESLVQPLRGALDELAGILPNLVAAVLILVLGMIVIRIAGRIAARMLTELGFDDFVAKVGLVPAPSPDAKPADGAEEAPAEAPAADKTESGTEDLDEGWDDDETAEAAAPEPAPAFDDEAVAAAAVEQLRKRRSPSEVAGMVVAVVLGLLIVSQVLSILQLYRLAALIDVLIDYLPDVGVAFIIVSAGIWAGNWAKDRVDELYPGDDDRLQRFLGAAGRIAILVFAAAVALQQLGVAPELINTTFAIVFGAICLAVALAFGLGGRDTAGEIVKKGYDRYTGPTKKTASRSRKKST